MKKRIFTLLLGVLFTAGLMGQGLEAVIPKVGDVVPVLDGEIDEVWSTVEQNNINVKFQAELPTLGNDGDTWWKMLWSPEGFYILVNVTDDAYYPNYVAGSGLNSWEYDKIEIYFDVNAVLEDGGGAGGGQGHYQFAPDYRDGEMDGTVYTEGNTVQHAHLLTEPNVVAEYFVPWSVLNDKDGYALMETATIGFDITVIDREEGDAARKRANWSNAGGVDEAWNNMNDAGHITLEGAVEAVIAESITIGGEGGATTIETDNGTLQMISTILPAETTIQTLAWSVVNGTGRAKIDGSGLLTGLVDGTVTVTGATKDGSFLEESVEITISHQYVTMWDLSVVRDGNFNVVDEDGTVGPAWNGGALVVDGVAQCAPSNGANPWDYTLTQLVNCKSGIPYVFSFVAWADNVGSFNVDFEDSNNGYLRYGTSTDPESNGTSDWTFDQGPEPVKRNFHVTFTITETTRQSMQFMVGRMGPFVYIDSVLLVAEEDLALLSGPIPESVSTKTVTSVNVYPNPVVDVLTVSVSKAGSKVEIYNSIGRKIEEAELRSTKATFDVSSYSKGIYFVKVNDSVVKFIK